MKKQFTLLALALAATLGVATATSYDWLSGAGDWTDTGWTTNGIPVSPVWNSSSTGIIHSGTMNLTPTANPGSQIAAVHLHPGIGSVDLNISGDLSLAERLRMGSDSVDSGTATITQTAGTVTLDITTFIGQRGSGENIYNLDGGTLSGVKLYVAANETASGTLNINGGALDMSGYSYLGYSTGNTGVLNMPDGTAFMTRLYVGNNGTGTANIGGGTLNTSAKVYIGSVAGSTGVLNLSNGMLHCTDWLYVGTAGSGSFYQTGGTAELYKVGIGYYTGSDGIISISGGSFTASNYIYGRYGNSIFEVDGSGATKIDVNAVVFNKSTDILRFKLDENGSTRLDAPGIYGSYGIDLANSTVEVGIIAGFDGVVGDTYDLMWTPYGFNTNGTIFSSTGNAKFDFGIVSKDGGQVLQATLWTSRYDQWTIDYNLTGDDAAATADPDGDGLDNLYEYGLGGDPTNSADRGISPAYAMEESGGTNWMTYVYPKRLDSGLAYYLELTEDLVYGTWLNSGYDVMGIGTIDAEFDAVTNRIAVGSEDEKFIQLIIEQ